MLSHLIPFVLLAAALASPARGTRCARSVAIDDRVLAGGKELGRFPPQPRFEVETINGRPAVVVKAWSKPLRRMVRGEIVKLDENNQFQPRGMRWRFTLKGDCLTWEEHQ